MGILDDIANSLTTDGQLSPGGQGLLAAGLGILAHNRGLTSGTQAIGLGGQQGLATFQGAQQAQLARQLGQQQLIQAQLQNRMLGGKIDFATGMQPGAQGAAPSPQSVPNPLAPLGGMGTTPTSMQGLAQSAAAQAPQQAMQQPAQAQNPFAPGGSFNPLGLDEQTARGMFLYDPNYAKNFVAPAYAPTDAQRAARAAGIQMNTPEYADAMQQALRKQNYITPTALRPGAAYIDSNGQLKSTPAAAPAGFENVPLADGTWRVVPVQGGLDALSSSEAAQARGKGQYKLTQVYNPQTQQMEYQTETNVADAAPGGASGSPSSLPAPIRNNNPGALMPGGKLAQYSTPQEGLAALDNNLANYGKRGINTLSGVISTWAPPNENDTQGYIADVAQRLGMKPNQQIDLSNPYTRHALSAAIMLHENGPSGVFGYPGQQGSPVGSGGGSGTPSGAQPVKQGGFAATAPLGTPANANAAQEAGAQTMKQSYSNLQSANSSANSALEALQKMKQLATGKGLLTTGALGTGLTSINPTAAEYEKQRANVVALLSKQLGTNGTDAGRALTGESVPDYGKPEAAIHDGLQTLMNQTRVLQMKANFLTPAYNNGDSKAYTDLENQFDQNVSPGMVPVLTMQPGPQRAAALKTIAQDPAMRGRLEWAIKNGILK